MSIPKGFFNDHLELVYALCVEPNKENPAVIDADTKAILKKVADQSLEVPLAFQMLDAVGILLQIANDENTGSVLMPQSLNSIGFLISGLASFGEACVEIEYQAEQVLKASGEQGNPGNHVPIPVTEPIQ